MSQIATITPLSWNRVAVESPYETRHVFQEMPRDLRTWDPVNQCWIVRRDYMPELFPQLEDAGCDEFRVKEEPPNPWERLMFEQLTPDQAARAYEALQGAFYPDDYEDAEVLRRLKKAAQAYG